MKLKIDFLKYKTFAFVLSGVLIILAIWFMNNLTGDSLGVVSSRGFNLGIDFQGGLHHQIKIYSGIEIEKVRDFALKSNLGSEIQEVAVSDAFRVGNETSFIIKAPLSEEDQKTIETTDITPAQFVKKRLQGFYALIEQEAGAEKVFTGDELARVNSVYHKGELPGEITSRATADKRVASNVVEESSSIVAPKFSRGLRQQAFFLIVFVLLVMLAYISLRFKPEYAFGAVIALFHDTMIMLGVIAVSQVELDLTVIAAVLTVIGYSINDTIVVYDRIRENTGIMKEVHPREIFNVSINQTLNRTIITSLTTLLAVVALLAFGGPKIHGFSFTLLIGIIVGTYSSIFIASPVVYLWDYTLGKNRNKYKKIESKQEKVAVEKGGKPEDKESIQENGTRVDADEDADASLSKKQIKKLRGGRKKK